MPDFRQVSPSGPFYYAFTFHNEHLMLVRVAGKTALSAGGISM
jgi:hypothetical protein